jgi:hypothetical protein
MKNVARIAFFALSLAAPGLAHAGITEGLGHWQGTGTTFAADGQSQGDFAVEVDRTAVDARTIDVRVKVTLADGKTLDFDQRQTQTGTGFITESAHGKGGGRCFGAGLCQSYEEQLDGTARASTIVVDGPNQLRVLITDLDHGRAVRFIRQTLTRKQ